jgi:hypothetical protein
MKSDIRNEEPGSISQRDDLADFGILYAIMRCSADCVKCRVPRSQGPSLELHRGTQGETKGPPLLGLRLFIIVLLEELH